MGTGAGPGIQTGSGRRVRSGRVRLGSAALAMGTEVPTARSGGWLAALLWFLLLPAGMRGSWSEASDAPDPAPDEAEAEEPGWPERGAQPLATGAGAMGGGVWAEGFREGLGRGRRPLFSPPSLTRRPWDIPKPQHRWVTGPTADPLELGRWPGLALGWGLGGGGLLLNEGPRRPLPGVLGTSLTSRAPRCESQNQGCLH